MKKTSALLVVDVQNDFCPGGALSIPEGDKIIPVINKCIEFFENKKLRIFITRDWHPKITTHFKKHGGVWPDHCIQNTEGAQFHPDLKIPKDAMILSKGTNPEEDAYSAFHAIDADGRKFLDILKHEGINELYICGLATDYCVKESTLEALKQGISVKVLIDGIKGVDLTPGDSERAVEEIVGRGAEKITFKDLLKE